MLCLPKKPGAKPVSSKKGCHAQSESAGPNKSWRPGRSYTGEAPPSGCFWQCPAHDRCRKLAAEACRRTPPSPRARRASPRASPRGACRLGAERARHAALLATCSCGAPWRPLALACGKDGGTMRGAQHEFVRFPRMRRGFNTHIPNAQGKLQQSTKKLGRIR